MTVCSFDINRRRWLGILALTLRCLSGCPAAFDCRAADASEASRERDRRRRRRIEPIAAQADFLIHPDLA